jgi:hypothetical protein
MVGGERFVTAESDTSHATLQETRKILEDIGQRLEREGSEKRPRVQFDEAPTLATCQDLISHAGHLSQDPDTALALGRLDVCQFLLDLAFSYVHQADDCLASLSPRK